MLARGISSSLEEDEQRQPRTAKGLQVNTCSQTHCVGVTSHTPPGALGRISIPAFPTLTPVLWLPADLTTATRLLEDLKHRIPIDL